MGSLTNTLRTQHRQLEELAFDLDEALRREHHDDVAFALVRLQRALQKHLHQEQFGVYHALAAMTEQSRLDVTSELALGHVRSLVSLDAEFKTFVQRHSGSHRDLALLKRDWTGIRAQLLDRIHTEEELIYPTFDSWMSGGARSGKGG